MSDNLNNQTQEPDEAWECPRCGDSNDGGVASCSKCGQEHPEETTIVDGRNTVDAEPYPEHVKLKAVSHLSQAQGAFIDWLREEEGIVLASYQGDYLFPATTSVQDLLAAYHGIDRQKIEAEKRAMLDELRSLE